MTGPQSLPIRTVGGEWTFASTRTYASPFADVQVDGVLTGPSGRTLTMPAFYDGDVTWQLRFNPGEAGAWRLALRSRPHDPDLDAAAAFTATDGDARGMLRATPGQAWG